MSRTVGPEHSGGCVLTLGAQLRGDVVAAQGGLVALFPWGICPLVSKYALRSPDSPDWRRSPISSLLAQFLQKQDSPGEVAALLCAAGAARAGFH